MNVLSLFDGMSCGRIALERAGIKVDNYYASEIKPHAIKVSKNNYPDINQVGDVTKLYGGYFDKVDLLIGGSPCQSFSNANQYVTDGTDGFDGKSKLFFEYVRLLKELREKNPDLKFLLENVRMKKEWRDLITKYVGVEPIEINSNIFTGQNRPRLYWINIEQSNLPADKNILLKDIIQTEVDKKYFLSEKAIAYMGRLRNGKPRWEYHKNELNGKAACLTANMFKGVPYGVIKELGRRLTPTECERLQGVPDNYTSCVSDTSRYNLLGDGWTVDVITHILKNLL